MAIYVPVGSDIDDTRIWTFTNKRTLVRLRDNLRRELNQRL
jgi:hypothetical protein